MSGFPVQPYRQKVAIRLPDLAGAACVEADPEAFFPDPGRRSSETSAALRVCANCQVRQECLQVALEGFETGIWGGTTYEARKRLLRASGRVA